MCFPVVAKSRCLLDSLPRALPDILTSIIQKTKKKKKKKALDFRYCESGGNIEDDDNTICQTNLRIKFALKKTRKHK